MLAFRDKKIHVCVCLGEGIMKTMIKHTRFEQLIGNVTSRDAGGKEDILVAATCQRYA